MIVIVIVIVMIVIVIVIVMIVIVIVIGSSSLYPSPREYFVGVCLFIDGDCPQSEARR